MRYNPHVVSRIERQAFQLVGDKIETKLRTHKEMTLQERESYFAQAVRREMQAVRS